MELTTLYRPVGPDELVLIEQSGWKRFPPRRPDQGVIEVTQEYYKEKK